MNLASFTEKGIDYPTLICDACGEPIKVARKAIITFPVDLFSKPMSYANGVYHKVRCDPGHQVRPYSEELSSYMKRLICSLRIGRIVANGEERQLVIDLSEFDDVMEGIGQPNW